MKMPTIRKMWTFYKQGGAAGRLRHHPAQSYPSTCTECVLLWRVHHLASAGASTRAWGGVRRRSASLSATGDTPRHRALCCVREVDRFFGRRTDANTAGERTRAQARDRVDRAGVGPLVPLQVGGREGGQHAIRYNSRGFRSGLGRPVPKTGSRALDAIVESGSRPRLTSAGYASGVQKVRGRPIVLFGQCPTRDLRFRP
jgi:hypothetical protein